jgi:predicted amidohydrolase
VSDHFRIAAAQLAPAFLNLEACLEIACRWIAEAGQQEINLLVFPETWLPGYPVWLDNSPEAALWDHPPAKALFRHYYENSPEIPSPAIQTLCTAANDANLSLVMGLSERAGGSLYNSMIYISATGVLLGVHRKLIPTYTERMIWGQGDGSGLIAVNTPIGRVGGLVCWEHWMPLTRQAMHAQEEILHAAVWPSVKETHLIASRAYAFEGRCFVIAAGSILKREHLPKGYAVLDAMPGDGPWMTGGSAIIGPDAQILAGPVENEESLVIAEIDPGRVAEEKMTLDVCGHYSRPDVFNFSINKP